MEDKLPNYLRPDIEVIVEKAITNLEEVIEDKLDPAQRATFILGFGAGMTTLKNFPEYDEAFIKELWVKFKTSASLNDDAKKWFDMIILGKE